MTERKRFLLRLPQDLHEEVSRWAAEELRSVNAQIEFLLRQAVRKRQGGRGAAEDPPQDPPPKVDPD